MWKVLFLPYYLRFAHVRLTDYMVQMLALFLLLLFLHGWNIQIFRMSLCLLFSDDLAKKNLTFKQSNYWNERNSLFINFVNNRLKKCGVSIEYLISFIIHSDDEHWQTSWNGENKPVSICQQTHHSSWFDCSRWNRTELRDCHFGRGNWRSKFWCWR